MVKYWANGQRDLLPDEWEDVEPGEKIVVTVHLLIDPDIAAAQVNGCAPQDAAEEWVGELLRNYDRYYQGPRSGSPVLDWGYEDSRGYAMSDEYEEGDCWIRDSERR